MGYAIAKLAKSRGHKVTLISGPSKLIPPPGAKRVSVVTARDMHKAVKHYLKEADCLIMSAAVADFRPTTTYQAKLKRSSHVKGIRLCKNPDILKEASKEKGERVLAGFCMETSNLVASAKKKMIEKKADIMVANKINRQKPLAPQQAPFGSGKTNVIMLGPGSAQEKLKSVPKEKVARILLENIEKLWYNKTLIKA